MVLPNSSHLSGPVLLDDPNYTAEQLQGKLAYVEQCLSADELTALLKIDGTDFPLNTRSVTGVDLPDSEVVFSTYFTSRNDPQRLSMVDQNNYEYIRPLYESVQRLSLGCIIFHDELTPEFISKYATDKIRFVRVELSGYSLNDERFFIYYEYLLTHGRHFEWVLLSDVSDVVISSSPFELFRQHPEKLFVGRSNFECVRHNYVQYQRIERFERDSGVSVPDGMYNMRIFNAGTIAGSRKVITYMLRQMIQQFNKYYSDLNHNMAVLNYCIYLYWLEGPGLEPARFLTARRIFLKTAMLLETKGGIDILPRRYYHDNTNYASDAVFAGYPFTSAFKKFENDSDAFLIHK